MTNKNINASYIPSNNFPCIVFSVLLPLLSACATHDLGEKPALQDLRQFEERNLSGFCATAFRPSCNLDNLTFAAFELHPDIEVARSATLTAEAAIETASESPNPTMNFSPQYISNPAGLPLWALGVGLDIIAESRDKKDLRIKQAESVSQIARLQIIQTAWQIRANIRSSFLSLNRAKELQHILEEEQLILKSSHDLLAGRAAVGQVSAITAIDANATLQRNKVGLIEIKQQTESGLRTLAAAIGFPTKALSPVDLDFTSLGALPSLSNLQIETLKETTLKNRADLLIAVENFEVAHTGYQLEIAKKYPDIHINPDFTWDQGTHKWGLFLSGALPIFNQNQGPIHEAEAKRNEAMTRFSALQSQIIGDLDIKFNQYTTALLKLRAAEEGLQAQTKQHSSLLHLLRPGDISRPIIYRSELAVSTARQVRLEAFYQAQLALGQIEDATQIFFFTNFSSDSTPLTAKLHQEVKNAPLFN